MSLQDKIKELQDLRNQLTVSEERAKESQAEVTRVRAESFKQFGLDTQEGLGAKIVEILAQCTVLENEIEELLKVEN